MTKTSSTRARGSRRGQAGFTLTELLMAIALFTIFGGGLYAAFFSGSDATSSQRTQLTAQSDSRAAVDRLTRELRQAITPDGGATAPVVAVSPTSITFFTDLDLAAGASGTRPSRVRYSVVSGQLLREEAAPVGAAPPYTYTVGYGPPIVLAQDVRTTNPVFQALTAQGVLLASPVPQPRDIAMVRIALSLGQRTQSKSTTTELTTDVTLRNPIRQ
jgi:prepilin-type N-terminal cleavage/methylation domain-containing protein